MGWTTTRDVRVFVAAAGAHLAADPVAGSLLLTESAYLVARRPDGHGSTFAWWADGEGRVGGALLVAPGHRPVVGRTVAEGWTDLARERPDLPPFDADARDLGAATAAWGGDVVETDRVVTLRLADPTRLRTAAPGRARPAVDADRALLTGWYTALLAALGDPSDLAYLVDDPLDDGGLVVWEADGAPVGVAGRSRRVAGVVRVGAAHSPVDERHGWAAFAALCAAEAAAGLTVLVACRAGDDAGERRYRALGFVAAAARITLDHRDADVLPHAMGENV